MRGGFTRWQLFQRCKNLPGDYFVIWPLLVSYHIVILRSLAKVDLFRLLNAFRIPFLQPVRRVMLGYAEQKLPVALGT